MSDLQSNAVEAENLKRELLAWSPRTDDRLRPLLLAEAGRRGAVMWGTQDAENVIAFLLSRVTATPAPSDQAEWQGIATAPRDESQILVEVRAGYYAVVSYWGGGWRESANGLLLRDPPLAWMAITAPTLTAGDGGGDA